MERTKTKQNVAIVCGGEVTDFVWLKEQLHKYQYIIAADSGYDKLVKCGVIPQVAIGDFDSSKCNIPSTITRYTYPAKKDKTDFMLSLEFCAENGFYNVDVFGALGGRIDHSLGAIFAVLEIKQQNVSASLITESCKAFVVNDNCKIPKNDGYVSLFAIGSDVKGVTLKGFEYPLDNATLSCCTQIGVSNKIIANVGEINLENGNLLVIIQN